MSGMNYQREDVIIKKGEHTTAVRLIINFYVQNGGRVEYDRRYTRDSEEALVMTLVEGVPRPYKIKPENWSAIMDRESRQLIKDGVIQFSARGSTSRICYRRLQRLEESAVKQQARTSAPPSYVHRSFSRRPSPAFV